MDPLPATTTEANAAPATHPKRALGFRDLVMFYVVTTLSLRWIPVAASSGPSSIAIWIVGLLTIFIPLALCVMELSSRYPQEGGMYLWIKRAYGDFPAFLTGWIYWTSNLPYFPAVLYFAASNALYVGGGRWSVRVGAHYRAMGRFLDDDETFLWVWIGSHEAYNRLV